MLKKSRLSIHKKRLWGMACFNVIFLDQMLNPSIIQSWHLWPSNAMIAILFELVEWGDFCLDKSDAKTGGFAKVVESDGRNEEGLLVRFVFVTI